MALSAAWLAPWRGCSLVGWDLELYHAETAEAGEVSTGWYRSLLPIFWFYSGEERGAEVVSALYWYTQKANLWRFVSLLWASLWVEESHLNGWRVWVSSLCAMVLCKTAAGGSAGSLQAERGTGLFITVCSQRAALQHHPRAAWQESCSSECSMQTAQAWLWDSWHCCTQMASWIWCLRFSF